MRFKSININSKLKAVRSILTARNAYTALLSQMYRQIFNNPIKRSLYRLLYSNYFYLGLRRVTAESVESTTYFLQHIDSLPKTDYISIKYEDLCNNPQEIILKILGFVGVEAKTKLAYDTLIETRPLNLLPEVQRESEQVCQKLHPYFTYHGYDR